MSGHRGLRENRDVTQLGSSRCAPAGSRPSDSACWQVCLLPPHPCPPHTSPCPHFCRPTGALPAKRPALLSTGVPSVCLLRHLRCSGCGPSSGPHQGLLLVATGLPWTDKAPRPSQQGVGCRVGNRAPPNSGRARGFCSAPEPCRCGLYSEMRKWASGKSP